MMTLSYFYTNNIPESIKLKDEILKLPCLKFFKVDVIDQHSDRFSQMEFLMSCHRDDVVIVDCTIPKYSEDKNERKNECSVFPILVAQVNMLDHVLVVSNNMLPLNITPQRQGYDSPRLEFNFTKEKQIKWIEEQIVDLYNLIKEGKHYNRVKLETYHDFSIYQEEMENMWSNSSEFRKSKEKGKKKVLISYRNSHIEEVKLYRDRYKKQHPEEVVRMIEPGILCSNEEALSPMRKWMLVFMLEEHIHDIDELIVYHTNDYTDSWWTCAELIMVFYNNYGRSKDKQIKIKYYDSNEHTEKNIEECNWLNLKHGKESDNILSKSQMNRLARLAANTRPGSMGPECMSNIEQMKMLNEKINNSNFFVRMIMRWTIKHMLLKSIPASLSKGNRNEMLRKSLLLYTNKEELKKYLADEVFDDTFWHSISFQTQRSTPAFVKQGDSACIDINYFLKAPMSEAVNLSIEKIQAFSENHKNFTIPTDTTSTTYIAKEITTSKYLWLATRMGQPTIVKDNIPGLERVPIFNIKKCE